MILPEQSDLSSKALAAAFKNGEERRFGNSALFQNGMWDEVTAAGKVTERGSACHGGMKGSGNELIFTYSVWSTWRYASYVTSYAKKPYDKLLDKAIAVRFYDWFVNRSWAADYIIAPSTEFARDIGFAISTRTPANYVLAVCTMSRHTQEQAHNVWRMYSYVDEFGVSEDLAFFLAFGCHTENEFGTIITGHNLFNNQGIEALTNWMKRTIKQTNAPYRDGASVSGVNAMWGKSTTNVAKEFEKFKEKVELDRVVIPNPFIPVVKTGTATMSEAFLRSIIPNLKAHFDGEQVNHVNPKEKRLAA